MASYTILSAAKPGEPDADAMVICDRFSWSAFLFGGFWLLWHRLWFVGIFVLLADIAISYATISSGQFVVGYAVDLALALLVGLEGRNWRSQAALNKGMRVVDIVEADNSETAFEKYAFRLAQEGQLGSKPKMPPRLPFPAAQTPASSMIGLVPSSRGH